MDCIGEFRDSPEVRPSGERLVADVAVVRLDAPEARVHLHVGHDGVAALEVLLAHRTRDDGGLARAAADAATAVLLALEFSSSEGGRDLVQLLVNEQVVGLGEVPLAGVALEKRPWAGRRSWKRE